MNETFLTNRTFDELKVGDTATLMRIVGRDDIDLFAAVSGDVNPVHLDATFAATDTFGHIVPHGMWSAALNSAVLGTKLPGPSTVYLRQEVRFLKPFALGDTITASATVRDKRPADRVVVLDTACTNQNGEQVLSGTATVIAPSTSIEWPRTRLPDVTLRRQDRYEAFVKQANSLPPITAAIIHPCSPEAILAAVEVRDQGLFTPLLVGPEDKIRAAADKAQVDLDGIAIEPVPHSHAAAARRVELAVAGKESVLVKGSLHTDELLGAVIAPSSGLRTERRISHVYAMDVPAYAKPLIITDAAISSSGRLRDLVAAASLDIENVGAMQQPVEDGGGQNFVPGKELGPVADALVGRDDPRTAAIAVADQPKEEACLLAARAAIAAGIPPRTARSTPPETAPSAPPASSPPAAAHRESLRRSMAPIASAAEPG